MGFEHYRVVIRFDGERSEYVAAVPELRHYLEPVHAKSRTSALNKLEEAYDEAVAKTANEGGSLPEAIDAKDSTYDGKLYVEIGASLHRDLAHRAAEENVSVEKLASLAMSSFLGEKHLRRKHAAQPEGEAQPRERDDQGERSEGDEGYNQRRGRRNNRQQNGPGYHAIMEDKASFMEYVRQQERGLGQGVRPPRRRGGGGSYHEE